MNKSEIKNIILKTAGYPDSGAIFNLADDIADAIIKAGQPEIKKFEPSKETRVVETKETR